ncbi:MAG: transporter substrate-binding domain-containing protein [Desulfamplus sp.]|nr:transporter substrate-binding domain-containing protein [Desulfamplus sp.]
MLKKMLVTALISVMSVLVFLIIPLVPLRVFADVITLRADNWYPYNGEPDSEKPGYIIEIADYIFKKAGHQIDYKLLNWARTCREVESGKWNGAVGGSYKETPDCIFPEEELGIMRNTFYVKKGETTWRYSGIESLKLVKVGIIKDYSYGNDELNDYLKTEKSNLVQVVYGDNPLASNIKKLLTGRIDVLIEDKFVLEAVAHKMGVLRDVEIAGELSTNESDYVFIAFSPNNPKSKEYANLITEGVREMRANGKLKEILSSYGLEDWK